MARRFDVALTGEHPDTYGGRDLAMGKQSRLREIRQTEENVWPLTITARRRSGKELKSAFIRMWRAALPGFAVPHTGTATPRPPGRIMSELFPPTFSRFSRRNFLALSGGATMAALTACSGPATGSPSGGSSS